MIADATSARRSTHASANSRQRHARLLGHRAYRVRRPGGWLSFMKSGDRSSPIASLAARESGGGGSPGAYLPVSTPCASGDQTICEMPVAAASRSSELGRPPEHRVLWLAKTRNSARRFSTAAWICSTVHSLKPRERALPAATTSRALRASLRSGRRGRSGAPGRGRRGRCAGGPATRRSACGSARPIGLGRRGPRTLAQDLGGQDVGVAGAAGEDLAPRGLGGALAR